MKKGHFTELVFIRVNGGTINSESSVERVDIDAYLPAAVNYAMTAGRNISLQTEGTRDLPSMFYGTFSDLEIDRTGAVAKITLPKGYAPLYGNEGLRSIFDDCNNYYTPLNDADRRNIKWYGKKMLDQAFYYPIGKTTVEVYPNNPLAEKLSGEYIVDVRELTDDDELPLAGDTEVMALDLCVQWITGERQMPSDKKNSTVDEANLIK